MVILGNIRNKAGNTFVVVAVCFLVVMMIGSDLGRALSYFFGSKKDQIGTLDGQSISYTDYHRYLEAVYRNFESKGKRPTAEDRVRLKDYAWRRLIEDMLYARETKEVGIAVGANELVDLVQGEHIDPQIMASFKNPNTGSFDKQKLLTRLSNLSKDEQENWCQFEKELGVQRTKEKLHQLMQQSSLITALEDAQATKRAKESCDVDYLYIPFTTVSNDLVALTNQQLKDYMAAHKSSYKAKESKIIKYITFPIEPDEKDNTHFQEDLNTLTVEFSTATDPYTFAMQHTDGHLSGTSLECVADELPDALVKFKHALKQGMILGPIAKEGIYSLYKVIDITKEQEAYNYKIAVIEKKVIVGDDTRNKRYREVKHFASQVKSLAEFKKLATNQHLAVQQEEVSPSNESIGCHAAARGVVRWLYNTASVGKISEVFDVGDAYLLVVLIDQVKAGDLVPLDSVFNEVYYKVVNQAKAKIIVDRLKQIHQTTLQDIAIQYGDNTEVKSVEKLEFSKNDNKHLRQAKAFVGKCFGLTPDTISDPLVDQEGVFVACVKAKHINEIEAQIIDKSKERMRQLERWMQSYYVSKAMEELAKVTDERYKFP